MRRSPKLDMACRHRRCGGGTGGGAERSDTSTPRSYGAQDHRLPDCYILLAWAALAASSRPRFLTPSNSFSGEFRRSNNALLARFANASRRSKSMCQRRAEPLKGCQSADRRAAGSSRSELVPCPAFDGDVEASRQRRHNQIRARYAHEDVRRSRRRPTGCRRDRDPGRSGRTRAARMDETTPRFSLPGDRHIHREPRSTPRSPDAADLSVTVDPGRVNLIAFWSRFLTAAPRFCRSPRISAPFSPAATCSVTPRVEASSVAATANSSTNVETENAAGC